jgi:ADP-ribose pyrophosphatase
LIHESIKEHEIYCGRAFTVRQDTVRLPNGRETNLDIVVHVGSVVILPVDEQGRIIFIKQYRHAVGMDILELPAGTLNKGEPPLECARRELREETAMAAGNLLDLGAFFLAPGYSSEFMHAYFADGLYASPLDADADEFLSTEAIPVQQALQMGETGLLPDAKSLAALLMARKLLEKWL